MRVPIHLFANTLPMLLFCLGEFESMVRGTGVGVMLRDFITDQLLSAGFCRSE
jgi:hypothetical protein